MAFTIPDDVLGTISKLSNYPNRIERLKAAALKAQFDADAKTVMGALKRLIQELGLATAARNVGFEKTTAVNADNVQDAIENVQRQIAGVSQSGIADASVTAAKIADGAVGTAAIADDAITADKLAMSAVDTDAIKWGAVDTYRLKDGAVTEAKLSNGVVTKSKIGYYAVEERHIKDNAVTGDKIANHTIGSGNIRERAIVTSALVDKAVTTEKIATGAVTNEKVGDKALVESLPVAASSATEESAVAVQTCKFVYAKALGVVLFQVKLQGLSSAEIADGVLLKLSNLTKPPKEFTSCAARVQYAPAQGDYEFTTAPALLSTAGYLTIRFPAGVVANANDVIMLSGWYFA